MGLEAIVFVGEFLQVLTGGLFSAAVHRVTRVPVLSLPSSPPTSSSSSSSSRVSCPFIVRGVNKAVLQFHSSSYTHPFLVRDSGTTPSKIADALEKLASFDGISMALLHRLLEMKRKKCFHRHVPTALGKAEGVREGDDHSTSDDGEWVLSAFPVQLLPANDSRRGGGGVRR